MQILDGPTSTIYAIAFSPQGEVVAGSKGGSIWHWTASGIGSLVYAPFSKDDVNPSVNALTFSPNGRRMVVGCSPHCYAMCELSIPRPRWIRFSDAPNDVTAVAYVDNDLLAVGTGNRVTASPGRFELWEFAKVGRREPSFHEPAGVRAIATHPPSRTVAWANGSRRVTIWDVARQDPIHFNLSHNSQSVGFHPEGYQLAATADYDIRVFDILKRHEVALLHGHRGRVTSVAFSPDGRTLATGSWDETVRFWDPSSGRELACFHWSIGKVFCLAYAPDGLRLAAGGDKGIIVVWDVE